MQSITKNIRSILGIAATASLMGISPAEAASFSIDTFEVQGGSEVINYDHLGSTGSILYELLPANKIDESEQSGTILGGYRDLDISNIKGANSFSTSSALVNDTTGSLSFSNAIGVEGILKVTWDGQDADDSDTDLTDGSDGSDGINYTGLGAIDLTQNGELEGILMGLVSADLNLNLEILVYTDENSYSSAIKTFDQDVTDVEQFFSFYDTGSDTNFSIGTGADSAADFTNVGAIQLIISAEQAAVDAEISFIESNINPDNNNSVDIPEAETSLFVLMGIFGLGMTLPKDDLKNRIKY